MSLFHYTNKQYNLSLTKTKKGGTTKPNTNKKSKQTKLPNKQQKNPQKCTLQPKKRSLEDTEFQQKATENE